MADCMNTVVTADLELPSQFLELRRAFGMLDTSELVESFGRGPLLAPFTPGSIKPQGYGGGLSSSLFYYTADQRYILKSLGGSELRRLERMMPLMTAHVQLSKHGSLLPRFEALFRVELVGGRPRGAVWIPRGGPDFEVEVHLVAMPNIYVALEGGAPSSSPFLSGRFEGGSLGKSVDVRECYDIKGSRFRFLGDEALSRAAPLKDLNFCSCSAGAVGQSSPAGHRCLSMATADHEAVSAVLNGDCSFLRTCGVMDYSLLVAVGRPQETGRECFRIGLVDILQTYTVGKRAETFFRVRYYLRPHVKTNGTRMYTPS